MTAMRLADSLVLQSLEPHMSPEAYAIACAAVEKAGGIQQLKDVAVLIELEKAKQSFGGDRSAAGRYAAQVRWGKKTDTSGGGGAGGEGGSGGGGAGEQETTTESETTGVANELISQINEWERKTTMAFEASGFDATEAKKEIGKSRAVVRDARDMDKAGLPQETIVGTLKQEKRRLKALTTRTRNKGQELQEAMGGQKRGADGKPIMTVANRLFTEAFVYQSVANLVDGLIQHFKYRPSRNR